MNNFKEFILVGEITLQAKIALRAAERLRATDDKSDDLDKWCAIQSILIAVANVSKILWPKEIYKARGESIRKFLRIENNNLLSNRKFRNHFEHYDERIEEYFKNHSGGVYVDLAMNPSLNSGIFGDGRSNTHRGYNSFNNTLVFRGETLDLGAVLTALEDILNNCNRHKEPHAGARVPRVQ